MTRRARRAGLLQRVTRRAPHAGLLLGGVASLVALASCMKPDHRGARLELADARIEFTQRDGAHHVVALSAQGALAFDGTSFATLGRDGQLLVAGAETAKLEKNGVLAVRGVASNVVIRPDGALVMNDVVEVSIAEDGTVAGSLLETMDHPRLDPEGGTARYVGPPAARRALMTGFAAFVTGLLGQDP